MVDAVRITLFVPDLDAHSLLSTECMYVCMYVKQAAAQSARSMR